MSKSQNSNKKEIIVLLNNIRSNENVGSIFRTCDATGVSKIILVGYTPAPVDRFGRENKGLTKASLGAEKNIKWEKVESLEEAIKNFPEQFAFEPEVSVKGVKKFVTFSYPNKTKHIASFC
jgi:tRNA G18 (ribose-2'-O)-methylase SpoU